MGWALFLALVCVGGLSASLLLMIGRLDHCAADQAPPGATPGISKRFRDVRVLRLECAHETVVSEKPTAMRVFGADGKQHALEGSLVRASYSVSLNAVRVATGEQYHRDAPLRCVVVRPHDEDVQFEWAMWQLGTQFHSLNLHTDATGSAYVCWQQYDALALLRVAEPRPLREALAEDFSWGFPYPDAVFDAYVDAPAGAWDRRASGWWPAIELLSVSVEGGTWRITVRNPHTKRDYQFHSTDGFEWSQVKP